MDTNTTHDEATKSAPTGRDRLRAFAADLLDTMETIDKPKTYLEVERAARAVMVMDRMMAQLDQAPRTASSRTASRSSGQFGDFDDDAYVSPYGGWRENETEREDEAAEGEDAQNCKDWAAIIEMKLNRLAKAKGYPPYGPGPQEPQLDEDDDDDDEGEEGDEVEPPAAPAPEPAPEPCAPADPPIAARPLKPSDPPFSRERPLGPYLASLNYPEAPRTSSGISTPPQYAISEDYYRLTPWRDPP